MDDARIIRARRQRPSDERKNRDRNSDRGNSTQEIDDTSSQFSIGLCEVGHLHRDDRADVG